ncbi:helix-turn-helix transcriptional regulator [Thalassotalea marina]|uniref:HTH luxR-type domain-containing protein n=1 Tax=Thalassotalea marina TaxID=1673741 RepID=A0A919EIJ4_9GAMM|nr:helix-turn-helix transcriptional regulator [Thalassotalea marina]GHF84260.1 hypothetical protein GCM10017161_09570 [Thalassotalea marina]
MKTIEWLIRNAQQINSQQKLNEFIRSIGEGKMYLWSGFIVNVIKSPTCRELDTFGSIPDWVVSATQSKLSRLDEKGLPLVVNKEELIEQYPEEDCCSFLVIPFSGFTNESGYFALGLDLECTSLTAQAIEQLGWFWSIIIPYIFAAYKKCRQQELPHITKRELECMKWASEGKTSWEISQILNISERTANFHLANCIEKTGSINRQQAIVRCLLQGQLLVN